MFWKNWPYWLRGGVIALLLVLVSFVLGEVCEFRISRIPNYGGLGLECLPFALPGAPLLFFPDLPIFYLYIIIILIWFLLGSLVGGIIGKVKNKKSSL